MSIDGSAPYASFEARQQISFDAGANWEDIIGMTAVTDSGGDSTPTELAVFGQGRRKVWTTPGTPSAESAEITLTVVYPASETDELLRAAKRLGTYVQYRWLLPKKNLFTPKATTTVTIASGSSAGALRTPVFSEGAGTAEDLPEFLDSPDYGTFSYLETNVLSGTQYFLIKEITGNTAIKVKEYPYKTANTAIPASTAFSVVRAPIGRPAMNCTVGDYGNLDQQIDGAQATNLVLNPVGGLADPKINPFTI